MNSIKMYQAQFWGLLRYPNLLVRDLSTTNKCLQAIRFSFYFLIHKDRLRMKRPTTYKTNVCTWLFLRCFIERFSFTPRNEIQVIVVVISLPWTPSIPIVLNRSLFQVLDHRTWLFLVSNKHAIKMSEGAENMTLW